LVLGDENVSNSINGSLEADFAAWTKAFLDDFRSGDRVYQLGYADSEDDDGEEDEADDNSGGEDDGLVDLEDIGGMLKKGKVRLTLRRASCDATRLMQALLLPSMNRFFDFFFVFYCFRLPLRLHGPRRRRPP
jgi:hypothetical protein